MNNLIQLNVRLFKALIAIGLAMACLGLAQFASNAFGVVPAPDGGYPGGNTAEGQNALFSLTTGGFNTAVGYFSLRSNSTGPFNTAVGAGALFADTGAGGQNTAIGAAALLSNINGTGNTASGSTALLRNTTGDYNVADGFYALPNNTTGTGNTAIGPSALLGVTTGNFNIGIGDEGGGGVTTASHVICIGAQGENVDNGCYIGNIFMQTTTNGVPVLVNSNNKLGTTTSSKRCKEDIKPMGRTSEALFSLKPVSFRYNKKIDPAGTSQLGL